MLPRVLLAAWFIVFTGTTLQVSGQLVDYARDVAPILTNHCWSCHGPDPTARQADLRLDLRDAAIAAQAILPEQPDASRLLARIHSTDPDQVMPPPDAKRPLSEEQKKILRLWIQQGAKYTGHWAFEPLGTSRHSADHADSSVVDRWVVAKLKESGKSLSPPADPATLARRVALDLTGLPPAPEELDRFLADPRDATYEQLVDRLLDSDSYAERMSAHWLDLARYADTNGYNNDEDRTMWPWRDWVIRAFRTNMPFDQFVIEQLAGDLLPNPTLDQKVATGFLRNQGHNTEGGIIAEEYRVEYVADRVHTTATVFLGLSMQCARCHDHKYDPISQREYFQFYAYFNNLDEKQASYSSFVGAEPFVRVPSADQSQRLADFEAQLAVQRQLATDREQVAEKTLGDYLASHSTREIAERFGVQKKHAIELETVSADGRWDSMETGSKEQVHGNTLVSERRVGQGLELDGASHVALDAVGQWDGKSPFSIGVWVQPSQISGVAILSKMDEDASYRGYDLLLEGGKVVFHAIHHWSDNGLKVATQQTIPANAWTHIALTSDGSGKASGVVMYLNGEPAKLDTLNDSLTESIATDQPLRLGLRQRSLPYRGRIDRVEVFHGKLEPDQVRQWFAGEPIRQWIDEIATPWEKLDEPRRAEVKRQVLERIDTEYPRAKQEIARLELEKKKLTDAFPAVMVMGEMNPPRETFVLKRGQYDQPDEKVERRVPAVFDRLGGQVPVGRLELARWLVRPDHPLTARVTVNRIWEQLFGVGLVKTVEDFGVTGEYPSHPELLDEIASQFIASGWDIRKLIRGIVLSQTYRQSSSAPESEYLSDPENRLLARGPRHRLSAEMIRDQALAISGLLVRKVGGPSVKPYQPDGLWEDVTVERRGKYVADHGEGLYRKSLYTFWKRTCPPPSMVTFDATNREVCTARRSRTNTPLQSLVLMNDPTYIEAARVLASSVLQSHPAVDQRIDAMFRRCLARSARPDEQAAMMQLLEEAMEHFQQQPELASKLLQVGSSPLDGAADAIETAAWSVVASTILNLDETITKR
ncbi:MAG: DUF1553 domain-containing protein [Pirellulaceae bacterium]